MNQWKKGKFFTLACILSPDYQVIIIILSCILTETISQLLQVAAGRHTSVIIDIDGDFDLQLTEIMT